MTRYEIRVDEVVLRGVPEEQAAAVRAALEARLTALAEEAGALDLSDLAVDAVRTRPVAAAEGPESLGRGVADRVWAAVTGTGGVAR